VVDALGPGHVVEQAAGDDMLEVLDAQLRRPEAVDRLAVKPLYSWLCFQPWARPSTWVVVPWMRSARKSSELK